MWRYHDETTAWDDTKITSTPPQYRMSVFFIVLRIVSVFCDRKLSTVVRFDAVAMSIDVISSVLTMFVSAPFCTSSLQTLRYPLCACEVVVRETACRGQRTPGQAARRTIERHHDGGALRRPGPIGPIFRSEARKALPSTSTALACSTPTHAPASTPRCQTKPGWPG